MSKFGPEKSEDEGRAYSFPFPRNKDNKYEQYPSVTTALKMVDKSDLMGWAAGIVADWCVNNLDLLQRSSVERGVNMARYRHNDYRNERASVGDGIHETVQAEHEGTWEFPKLNDEQQAIMGHWRLFTEEHEIKPVYTELSMFNRKVGYAGTADGIWWIDGKLSLVDLKTSRSTWPEHRMQLAALGNCDEWVPKDGDWWKVVEPLKIEQLAIVHLRADLHELIVIDPELADVAWEEFQAYLAAWNGKQKRRQVEKRLYGEF